MKRILLLFVSVLFGVNNFAQIKDSTAPVIVSKKTISTIFTGAVYAPRLHYFGRTDNQKSSALVPTLLVQFDSARLYASGTGVLLSNNSQKLDYAGTVTEVGLRFGKPKGISGNIYGNKFFYNTTQLPQSALKEQAGINVNYLSKIINITTGGSAAFSESRTDFFTTAGINKNLKKVKGKSVFVITPTAVINAGSQNFTSAYYKQNTIAGVPVNNTVVMENSRRFNVLSYEFSSPVIWAYKQLFLIATPTVVLPQSVINMPNFPQYSETAQNLFFVNFTALYSLKMKK